ncbi:hypothetical protein MXB_4920 [Myxobolus squamalis]|nr:hypothetical protein MXB_4920 [Myxobolus squamalis]
MIEAGNWPMGCKASLVVQGRNIYLRKSEYVCDKVAVTPVENKEIQECTQPPLQGYAKDCRRNDADVHRHIIGELKERSLQQACVYRRHVEVSFASVYAAAHSHRARQSNKCLCPLRIYIDDWPH